MRPQAALVLFLLASGCLRFEVDPGSTPAPTVTATPTPVPTGTPAPCEMGTGGDGDVVIARGDTVAVNTCFSLLSVSGSQLQIESAQNLTVGQALVLVQVQEPLGLSYGTATPVSIEGGAGRYEIVRVTVNGGTTVDVSPAPTVAFVSTADSRAQACTIPEYRSLSIAGRITPSAWDGYTGGVVAFFVQQSLTLQAGAAVDASETGFRGGLLAPNLDVDQVTALDLPLTDGGGGGKGEGIDPLSWTRAARGNLGSAGGGGNARDAGGGGGGNAGDGGIGAPQNPGAVGGEDPATAGMSGSRNVPDDSAGLRVIFGSGGGATHRHNDGDPTGHAGANGGGLVLVHAATLAGAGDLLADGGGGLTSSVEGGGGGGAGGTVLLRTLDASGFTGKLGARGGDGNSIPSASNGPGGGGGGGRVLVLSTSLTAALPTDVDGGSPGSADVGPRGASGGEPGPLVTQVPCPN